MSMKNQIVANVQKQDLGEASEFYRQARSAIRFERKRIEAAKAQISALKDFLAQVYTDLDDGEFDSAEAEFTLSTLVQE